MNLERIQHRWHISALWGDSKAGGWNHLEVDDGCQLRPQLGCPSVHLHVASPYMDSERLPQSFEAGLQVWVSQESHTEVHDIAWSSLRRHIMTLLPQSLAWGCHKVAQVEREKTQTPPLNGKTVEIALQKHMEWGILLQPSLEHKICHTSQGIS